MRLRHLDSVSGRGLLAAAVGKGASAPPAAHYFTLCARCPAAPFNGGSGDGSSGSGDGGDDWRLVYRSEAVSAAAPSL